MEILRHLHRFPPGKGAEWGSGGIFGLRYYNNVLYFTLSFDGKAYFLRDDAKKIYEFELVGEKPVSGGDTYNAVESVDEFIYFGGWIHAPVKFDKERRKISFMHKYSHVHAYSTESDEVKLLWKEGAGMEDEWAGEVSDIIYDPCEDKLLLCREDGHVNTGIYELGRRGGEARVINENPCLKGAKVHDFAFFGIGKNFDWGMREVHVLDLVTRKWQRFSPKESVDRNPFVLPKLGDVQSAYNRMFAFVRGGAFIGNPFLGEEIKFFRLFDFPDLYAPIRVNALPLGGGILAALNAHHDACFRSGEDFSEKMSNLISSPSLVIYMAPPSVKIVAALGARVTSMEKMRGKILLGCNTTPNSETSAFETGNRDVVIFDEKIIREKPPDLSIAINGKSLAEFGKKFNARAFGGIPLEGYKECRMIIHAKSSNALKIYEYDLSLPLEQAEEEKISLERGRNSVDLSSFCGVVSFKLEKPVEGKIRIKLLA